jgi:hypothetical protein
MECKTKLHTWQPTPNAHSKVNFCNPVGQTQDTSVYIVTEFTEDMNKMVLKSGTRFQPKTYL